MIKIKKAIIHTPLEPRNNHEVEELRKKLLKVVGAGNIHFIYEIEILKENGKNREAHLQHETA